MKKSIALFAAAALSLGLAACSNTEAETETGALIIDGRTVSGAGGAFVRDGEVQFGDGTGDGAFDRTETNEGAGGAWSDDSSSDLPLGGDTRSTRGSGGALEGVQLDRDGYLLSLDCRKTLAYLEDANRAGGSQVLNLDRATAYNGARTAFSQVASSTDNEELASVLVEFDGLDHTEFAAALDATGAAVIEACNA